MSASGEPGPSPQPPAERITLTPAEAATSATGLGLELRAIARVESKAPNRATVALTLGSESHSCTVDLGVERRWRDHVIALDAIQKGGSGIGEDAWTATFSVEKRAQTEVAVEPGAPFPLRAHVTARTADGLTLTPIALGPRTAELLVAKGGKDGWLEIGEGGYGRFGDDVVRLLPAAPGDPRVRLAIERPPPPRALCYGEPLALKLDESAVADDGLFVAVKNVRRQYEGHYELTLLLRRGSVALELQVPSGGEARTPVREGHVRDDYVWRFERYEKAKEGLSAVRLRAEKLPSASFAVRALLGGHELELAAIEGHVHYTDGETDLQVRLVRALSPSENYGLVVVVDPLYPARKVPLDFELRFASEAPVRVNGRAVASTARVSVPPAEPAGSYALFVEPAAGAPCRYVFACLTPGVPGLLARSEEGLLGRDPAEEVPLSQAPGPSDVVGSFLRRAADRRFEEAYALCAAVYRSVVPLEEVVAALSPLASPIRESLGSIAVTGGGGRRHPFRLEVELRRIRETVRKEKGTLIQRLFGCAPTTIEVSHAPGGVEGAFTLVRVAGGYEILAFALGTIDDGG